MIHYMRALSTIADDSVHIVLCGKQYPTTAAKPFHSWSNKG